MNKKDCPYCGNECTRQELQICEIDGCGDIVCHECIKAHVTNSHSGLTRPLEDDEWNEIK